MSRSREAEAHSAVSANPPGPRQDPNRREKGESKSSGVWIARSVFLLALAALVAGWQPLGISRWTAAGIGGAAALLLIFGEAFISRGAPMQVLLAAAGATAGIFAAFLVTLILARTSMPEPARSFLSYGCLLAFGYLGMTVGAAKGKEFGGDGSVLPGSGRLLQAAPKLLDTSVLIDGRIAEICEAQFLDGPLQVPRFVLHELQMIADSSETLRRQRGRRGLEVLQRLQKMPGLQLTVLEEDGSGEGDVDRALVELARRLAAKIVTNDFNLNKVASVQGIGVLNVNQLANALRPVVLPGESMRVMILREGKEANQGVAFLEDGTMVVVDGARRFTNKTVDI